MQPVFVGRSEETAVLHRAIESVERGAGSFVHVVGEAGIGKTSLLDVATTELDRRAVPTRAVIADETDRRRRLAVVRALFPEVDWSSERDPVGGAIAAAERLAAPGPAALIADDVHWADEASLDVLRALSRRAGVLGLLVVTAVRPVPASIELDRLGESAQLHGHRLFLEPLDGEQLDLLVERRFGGRPGPHLGGALRETAGNPFLAVELVGALVDDGVAALDGDVLELSDTAGLPEDLGDRLARHTLMAVPDGALMLRAAAVLPGGFTAEELAAVLDRPLTDVLDTALAAVAAAVLVDTGTTLAFRHELLRRAVLDATPASIVRTLHRRAADILGARHADPERVTTCLLAGCDPADPHDTERLLLAGRDLRQRNPGAAADLLAAGLDGLAPQDDRIMSTTLDLGWALVAAGRAREVPALLARRRAPLSGRLWIERNRLRGIALSLAGRLAEVVADVDDLDARQLAEELDLTDQAAVDAAAELGLLWVTSERPDQARDLLTWVERSPTPASPFRVASMATVRAWLSAVGVAFEDAVDHARAALDAVSEDDTVRATPGSPLIALTISLDFLGRSDDALATLRAPERYGTLPRWTPPLLQFATGLTLFRRGDWDDALAEMDAGLLAADEVDLGLGVFWPYGIATVISCARGQREAAQLWLARSSRVSGTRALGAEWLGYGAALVAEADGDAEGAAAVLEHIAARILDAEVPALLLTTGADTVRLALATGRSAIAERVTAALSTLPDRTSSPVVAGIAAWAAGLHTDDHESMAAAADLLADGLRHPEATRARHDAAVAAARRGDESEARRLAKEAFAAYDALGAEQLHARLRSELRRGGIVLRPRRTAPRPSHGWDSLTPSEQTIVQLVADGLTNTETAEHLYVSRRTVESHLGRVYTKLDLATRAQLVAAATRHRFA